MLAHQTQNHLIPAARRIFPLSALVFVTAYWSWLCWTCAGDWIRFPDYSYGWLMAPLAAYFLWRRLCQWKPPLEDEPLPVWPWFTLGLAAVLAGPVELLRLTPIPWRPFLWAIYILSVAVTLACARLAGGKSLMKVVAFPCLFMVLAVPWPTFVEQATTYRLMHVVADAVSGILLFAGVPAFNAGTTIQLPNCIVGIEEACSGLRSVQAAMMISLAVGELMSINIPRRIALLACGLFLAFAGNIVRTLLLAWAGITGGPAMINKVHDIVGMLTLLLMAAGLVGIGLLLKPPEEMPVHGYRSSKKSTPALLRSPEALSRVAWYLLAACLFVFCAHLWFLPASKRSYRPASPLIIPREESQTGNVIQPMPEEMLRILKPTLGRFIHPANPAGEYAGAYHIFWKPSEGNATQMYHRPDICMPGAGWQPAGAVERMDIPFGGVTQSWYVFPYEQGGRRAFLIWLAMMDDRPVEMDFNRNIHLQRETIWNLLVAGKRSFQYEVAAVLVFYPGQTLPPDIAEKAVHQFFKPGESPTDG